jgi:hypothetical protein
MFSHQFELSVLRRYPFDTVKVRLQTLGASAPAASATGLSFSGPMDCIVKTWKNDGFMGFYRGLSSPVVGAAFEAAVLFSSFGQMTYLMTGSKLPENMTMQQVLTAGAVSGFAVAHVLAPVELVKCKIQVQTKGRSGAIYSGPLHCAYSIMKSQGPLALFHGYQATVFREIPGNIAWFGAYETAIRSMTPVGQKRESLPSYYPAIAGALGGMGYWLSMFPIDTVKSRIQSGVGTTGGSFFSVFAKILASEGLRGLYAGMGITLARALPSNALIFTVYEEASRFMNK